MPVVKDIETHHATLKWNKSSMINFRTMVKALNKAPQNKPTPTNTTRVAIIDANGTFPKFSVKAERNNTVLDKKNSA